MQFDFYFEFCYGNSWPELQFSTDAMKVSSPVDEYNQLVSYHTVTDDCKLTFKRINKKESDTVLEDGKIVRDQTVKLVKILVDDILLDANLIRPYTSFRPEYSPGYLEYCKQHSITPPEVVHEDVMYFNGDWSFEFKKPFWSWYAECRHLENIKHFSRRELELYIGTTNQEHTELLEQLKELLKNYA